MKHSSVFSYGNILSVCYTKVKWSIVRKGKVMSKTLTEKQVLKKIGIPDFRHLSKEKVMKFATMLPHMDPEVAKKALEQFPEFSKTTKEMLVEYKEYLDKGLASNDKSIMTCYDAGNAIISSLQKELGKEELSFEERKYIIDKMMEVSKMMNEKDSENKKFLAFMAMLAGTVVTVGVGALASALGSNSHIESSEDDSEC